MMTLLNERPAYGNNCSQPIFLCCETRTPLLFKKQRSLMYIVTVWCAALAGSVPPFFFGDGRFEFQPDKAMCLYTFESNIAYTIFIECVYIATPLTRRRSLIFTVAHNCHGNIK